MQHGGGIPSPPPLPPPPPDVDQHGQLSGTSRARWSTVNDAMAYLDAVKIEFRDQPEIYDEFLSIMGRFKTREMLPPDVILEVARLFRGRDDLVLRFNRFLPEGYKIGPADIKRMEDARLAEEQASARSALGGPDTGALAMDTGNGGQLVRGSPPDGATGAPVVALSGPRVDLHGEVPDSSEGEDENDMTDPNQPFDFNHAVKYVTAIKQRFSGDPDTYKAFLDVLHTYQRQRHHNGGVISSVLEEVTDLFADHPDLLREFTYFLPDGVQADAKERLDRAAEDAEIRLGLRSANGRLSNGQRFGIHSSHGGFHFAHGRGKLMGVSSSRGDQSRGHRPLHREQDWHEQHGHRIPREGPIHGGYHQGYTPRAPYANGSTGGDPSRGTVRHSYPGTNDILHGSMDGYRGERRLDRTDYRRRNREIDDFEVGPETPSRALRKRGRIADYHARRGGGGDRDTMGATGVFRASPEHELFNQTRQVLSSGGDANDWFEFLKCLDLFGNRVFGREEMVDMVRSLFESHNEVDLMEDFKKLMERRGSLEPLPRDTWPAMGLSEINFQSAKKCTPSYRELPSEYQKAVCSGRSAAEDKVLNDRWVSVPVGSEDSSSNFKHMRRNLFEDFLFKTEDEHFEMDMLIDGVSATIARLEPLEEEIEALNATRASAIDQQREESPDSSDSTTSLVASGGKHDVPLPRFQYRLDRRTLGSLHWSMVLRLYGEHGGEVVDLLRKNPAKAVPVVLRRFRQKQAEWRATREKMKSAWKESGQKNFHKSLDHRSLHFRREDKRNTSSRVLLQEIRDKKLEEDPHKAAMVTEAGAKVPDAHDDPTLILGRVSPVSTAADVESLSACQGSTGDAEVATDCARSDGGTRDSPEASAADGDIAPITETRSHTKEGIRLLRQQAEENPPWYMFAHLALQYPTEDTGSIHQDILELIAHTITRRPQSDEEARHTSTIVANLIPTFFRVGKWKRPANGADASLSRGEGDVDSRTPADSTQQAVVLMPTLSSDDDSDHEDGNANEKPSGRDISSHAGSSGEGQSKDDVQAADQNDQQAVQPAQVQSVPMDEDGISRDATSTPLPQNQEVFFATTDFYVALRMHHLLAERLATAKELCPEARLSSQTPAASAKEFLRMDAGVDSEVGMVDEKSQEKDAVVKDEAELRYKTFLAYLCDLIEDKINAERYDEGVRQLLGNQGYVLCNLDKLVLGLVQNLYRASSDKIFSKLVQLYYYERSAQPDGVVPSVYRNHVQQLLRRSDKEIVRVQYHPGSSGASGSWDVKPTLKMEYIGLLDIDREKQQDAGGVDGDLSLAGGCAESKSPIAAEVPE